MSGLDLRLLGPPYIERDGRPLPPFKSRKVLALLTYLALSPGVHSRSHLAGVLWSDCPERKALNNLRYAVWNLNETLGLGFLQADRVSVAWLPRDDVMLDTDEFLRAVEQAQDLESATAVALLERAVELYRGDLVAGLDVTETALFSEWLEQQRAFWRELALDALYRLSRHYTIHYRLPQAIATTRRLLTLDPWREEAHRQMMLLLARNGQRIAALTQYETCRQILKRDLGLEPSPETLRLRERIHAMDPAQRHNLPPQPTLFIGRENELVQVIARLQDPACRLLTLTGPGGIGKTRLALQVGQQMASEGAFLDGIWFLPLGQLDSAELVVSALAASLGLRLTGREPQAHLLNYLRDKELLLILDSLEHLLPDVRLIIDLLRQTAQAKLLVTSRERLNLQWEWLFEVGGLSYPSPVTACQAKEQPGQYSAVNLLLQAAHRLGVTIASAEEHACAVRLCQLVEGMPLAIELAASWLRDAPCSSIVARLSQRLDTLATTMHDLPERHRSLRTAVDQSWNLLSEEERAAFRQLAVFRGGFDTQAAGALVGESSLNTLVAKSLVRQAPSGRYEMHELLRQYAAEKLFIAYEQDKTRDRHCHYYAAFLHQRTPELQTARQREALAAIRMELDNVRTGWDWAVEQSSEPEIELAAEGLGWFYLMTSGFLEGEQAFTRAVERLRTRRADSVALGQVMVWQGVFCIELGWFSQAREALEAGLAILRRLGAKREMPLALVYLGSAAYNLGQFAQAQQYHQASLDIAQELDEPYAIATALMYLGTVGLQTGEYVEAHRFLEASLTRCRQIGDQFLTARVLNNLGNVAFITQHPAALSHTRSQAEQLLGKFESQLGPGALATVVQRGRNAQLDKIIVAAVKELS